MNWSSVSKEIFLKFYIKRFKFEIKFWKQEVGKSQIGKSQDIETYPNGAPSMVIFEK